MWGGAFWAIKHPPLPTVAGWSQIQRWVSSFYTEVVNGFLLLLIVTKLEPNFYITFFEVRMAACGLAQTLPRRILRVLYLGFSFELALA